MVDLEIIPERGSSFPKRFSSRAVAQTAVNLFYVHRVIGLDEYRRLSEVLSEPFIEG